MFCCYVAKASKLGKMKITKSPCAGCNKAFLKNEVNFFLGRSGPIRRECCKSLFWAKASRFTCLFLFCILKENKQIVKMILGLFTFLQFRSAERPERMGHNTCKSMGQVIVRDHIHQNKVPCDFLYDAKPPIQMSQGHPK